MTLAKVFRKNKNIIIGAIHLPPLLSYKDFPGLNIALKNALADLKAFESGGVDGVIFLADSQLECLEQNLTSMVELKEMMEEEGVDWENFPLVLQYNKRDLTNAIPVAELKKLLNPRSVPEFETVATQGRGVLEALKSAASQVLKSLKN